MSDLSEAVVLAGGRGTRLESAVKDVPKPMAPVAGRPFLAYLLDQLAGHGMGRVVLSVGHRWEAIADHFGESYRGMELSYAVESTPLGTGGGLRLACRDVGSADVLVVNGDTFFDVDVASLHRQHVAARAHLSIALKRMEHADRYGTVDLAADGRILAFVEKQPRARGLVNGGIYVLSTKLFDEIAVGGAFSFEKDVMERHVGDLPFYGFEFTGYFIDIGIPEDYHRAEREHRHLMTG